MSLRKTFCRTHAYELHEDPDFVPIIVHEEVVDLVEVVHHGISVVNFPSLRTDNSTQFLDTSPVIIGLVCSTVSENLLFLSFKENPDFLIF